MTCFLEIVFLFRTMLNKGRGYCQTYNFPKNIFWKTTYFKYQITCTTSKFTTNKIKITIFLDYRECLELIEHLTMSPNDQYYFTSTTNSYRNN